MLRVCTSTRSIQQRGRPAPQFRMRREEGRGGNLCRVVYEAGRVMILRTYMQQGGGSSGRRQGVDPPQLQKYL
jgi:hypothetical protein